MKRTNFPEKKYSRLYVLLVLLTISIWSNQVVHSSESYERQESIMRAIEDHSFDQGTELSNYNLVGFGEYLLENNRLNLIRAIIALDRVFVAGETYRITLHDFIGSASFLGSTGPIWGFTSDEMETISFEWTMEQPFEGNPSISIINSRPSSFSGYTLERKEPNFDRTFVNFSTSLNVSSVISMSQMNNTIEGDNLSLWTRDGSIRQTFRLRRIAEKGENVYQIFNHAQNQILAWNRQNTNSQQIFMHKNENKDEHFWFIEKQDCGAYVITNYADPNMVLDLTNSNTNNGTAVQLYPRNNTNAQRWNIDIVERPLW